MIWPAMVVSLKKTRNFGVAGGRETFGPHSSLIAPRCCLIGRVEMEPRTGFNGSALHRTQRPGLEVILSTVLTKCWDKTAVVVCSFRAKRHAVNLQPPSNLGPTTRPCLNSASRQMILRHGMLTPQNRDLSSTPSFIDGNTETLVIARSLWDKFGRGFVMGFPRAFASIWKLVAGPKKGIQLAQNLPRFLPFVPPLFPSPSLSASPSPRIYSYMD
jgi:hypothetical protein